MIDLSADYWSTYRPTLSASLSVDTSADSQSTITWHIGQYVDPESVYRYGNQESADKLIEYRPIVSIEGCTNKPFPSSRKSHFQTEAKCETFVVKRCTCRLQNSPYFCVFKYTRAVKQKVWNEAENRERDWGETLKIRFFFSRFARVRLLRHALPISLLILRKKPTVLQSTASGD